MQVWNETFAKWLGPIPAAMHGPCCAEFIVSRERIMAHPRYSAHDLIASLYVHKNRIRSVSQQQSPFWTAAC